VGAQSNPYLDPLLSEWDPTADPRFLALTPVGAATWDTPQWRLQAFIRSRLYAQQSSSSVPQFSQVGLSVHRDLAADWRLGVQGGLQRYQLNATRDTGWLIPSVRWALRRYTTVSLAGGLSRRWVRTFDPVQRQTSVFGSLTVRSWLTDRLRGTVRGYLSDGQSREATTGYGGAGATLGAQYLASDAVTVTLRGTVERLFTDANPQAGTDRQTDLLGRVHAGVDWQVAPGWTAFAEVQGLVGDMQARSIRDSRIATGVRFRWNDVAYAAARPKAEQYCAGTDGGVRFRVRYTGEDALYITGDFNGWEVPGVRLTTTGPGSDLYVVTLPLPTGRYEYRLHHAPAGNEARNPDASKSSPEWMDLPPDVVTTRDSFGGQNGVCVIP
jgi:hypothetical protein